MSEEPKVFACPECRSKYLLMKKKKGDRKFICKKCRSELRLRIVPAGTSAQGGDPGTSQGSDDWDIAVEVEKPGRKRQGDRIVGKVLGNCKIMEKVGEGRMGVVYKGRHLGYGRTVALKMLTPYLTRNEVYIQRFRQEAMTIAQLENKNIVQIYNIGKEGQYYFIELEFVDGESLSAYLSRHGRLELPRILYLVSSIASGLADAHRKEIVHRDIKPQNVLLTTRGRVKISDFGLAMVASSQEARFGRPGVVGTPYYMSPEQCRGEHVDGSTDIYALGVMLYYMLTGVQPFEGETKTEVLVKQLSVVPRPVVELAPEVPQWLSEITMRMLEKDPKRRFANGSELLAELETHMFVDGETSSTPAGPALSRQCPYCNMKIDGKALECPFCRASLVDLGDGFAGDYTQCPFCGQVAPETATECSACGGQLPAKSGQRRPAANRCPRCKEPIHPGLMFCEYCGETLRPGVDGTHPHG